jgi:shikimate kinase
VAGDRARHLVLVGLMGSGKTTVGTAVAEHLGWPFVDSDEQVEARTGRTVREIFEADGEPAFRALEAEALAEALADERRTVVAAAGGVVLREENRALLRRCGTVVWLRGRPEMLAERAASGEHRPLLRDDPLGVMREMALDRHDLYEEVADAVVDVDDRDPDAVTRAILELVR